jgi:hypothetical protein
MCDAARWASRPANGFCVKWTLDSTAQTPILESGNLGRVSLKEKPMQLIRAAGLSAVVVSLAVVGTIHAGDAVQSGLKVGHFVSPFNVDDITGPNQGKTLCYR